jgi:SOS-response transcriptional repressor LexA
MKQFSKELEILDFVVNFDDPSDFSDANETIEHNNSIENLHFQDKEGVKTFEIPILGSVSAGLPLFTEGGRALGHVNLTSYDANRPSELYFVKVNGDSMINAKIQEDDMLLVRKTSIAKHGDIVIALIEGNETTCKRLMVEKDVVYLKAENDNYKNIYSDNIVIQGVVEKLIRNTVL